MEVAEDRDGVVEVVAGRVGEYSGNYFKEYLMFKQIALVVMVAIMMIGANAVLAKAAQGGRNGRGIDRDPPRSSRLDKQTRQALVDSLDDERYTEAFYNAVMKKFEESPPFSNIARAEARHAEAIEALMTKYGVDVPENTWLDRKITVPKTWTEACSKAIEAENENIAMYEKFLQFVQQDDIRGVMEQLKSCSEDRHLPAFERSSQNGRGRGPGNGTCPGCGRGPGGGRGNGFRGGRN